MTETTETTSTTEAQGPDAIEGLLRERGLRALYWTVGDSMRVDETDPKTPIHAPLTVLYTNGKRYFKATAMIDLDVIYALVGSDEVVAQLANPTVDFLLEVGTEVPRYVVELAEEDEAYARTASTWAHTDGDLIRAAADSLPNALGELLEAIAPIVDGIEPGSSFATPEAQLAAVAMRIAWELL